MAEGREELPRDHSHRYWREPIQVPDLIGEAEPERIESEFARLAEYLPTLCWIARGDGYIVWYNRRWHEYCGTTPEEMEGWGWQIARGCQFRRFRPSLRSGSAQS